MMLSFCPSFGFLVFEYCILSTATESERSPTLPTTIVPTIPLPRCCNFGIA
ncbi:hypothetical protein V6Z12_A05G323700 [Gossypium hirsutum]